jgi:CheY-like chemotaxis protein
MSETQKTILVVDDAPANIQLLSGILRGKYKVKAATGSVKALKIANGDPAPDLILLDVIMPDTDGYQVCRSLKDNPSTAAIPVIFISGNLDETERSKGKAAGAVDYLGKPVDPDDLLARIENSISK